MFFVNLNVKDVKTKPRAFNSLFEVFHFLNVDKNIYDMLPKSVRKKFTNIQTNIYHTRRLVSNFIPRYNAGWEDNIVEVFDSSGNKLDYISLIEDKLTENPDYFTKGYWGLSFYNIFGNPPNLSGFLLNSLDRVNPEGNNYYRRIRHIGYNRAKYKLDFEDGLLRDEYAIGIGGKKTTMVDNWDDIPSGSKYSNCWKKEKIRKQYMKFKVM